MRILITGICGFVGSTLAHAILDAMPETEVFGIDNLSRAGSWLNKAPLGDRDVQVYHGDIRSASDVESLPRADWVIDAAANPSVLAGVDGKTSSRQLVQHNLGGTVNLLEYCKRHESGFILLSTSRVYTIPPLSRLAMRVEKPDDWRGGPWFVPDLGQGAPPGISRDGVSERYSTAPPVSLYGSTKVASEHLALEYGQTFGFPVWINRCGVMAGAQQFGHPAQGIFAFWIHSFRERHPLRYIGFGGHGYQVRDALHPRDVWPLLRQQIEEPYATQKPRTLNVAGGVANSMSLAQLSHWCAGRFDVPAADLVTGSDEERPFDIPWMVLDAGEAEQVWGWNPTIPLLEILTEIAAFAEDHPHWLDVSTS